MDQEIQPYKPEPKISTTEIILFGVIFIICDIVELIPVAGDFVDVIVGLPFDFYIFIKGLNGTVAFIDQLIEAIPIAQEIPLWTFSWGTIIFFDRNPKLVSALAPVIEAEDALEGNVEAEREALANQQRAIQGNSKTLEMTKGADGSYSYAPAGAQQGEAAAGGTPSGAGGTRGAEQGAGRPSDESTERNLGENMTPNEREARESGDGGYGSGDTIDGGPAQTQEQQREAAANRMYEEATTTEAARNPLDVVREKELGDDITPDKPKRSEEEAPEKKESPEAKRLRERFEALQKARQKQSTPKPRQNDDQDSNYLREAA